MSDDDFDDSNSKDSESNKFQNDMKEIFSIFTG
jgi:hypothetical protein